VDEPKIVRIGAWTVDPTLNLLENGGNTVRLEPRTMELLLYFARHPHKVLSTDQLLKELWRGRVVEDSAVYKRVTRLRKVLADDPRAPRYIQTIAKRGYRLVARVVTAAVAGVLAFAIAVVSIPVGDGSDGAEPVDPWRMSPFFLDPTAGDRPLPTSSPEAYALFVRATRDTPRSDPQAAHRLLDRAVALDPHFGAALNWQADLYAQTLVDEGPGGAPGRSTHRLATCRWR
jgi:DNA-binding winged helix-turn-helix (wHTH) protein